MVRCSGAQASATKFMPQQEAGQTIGTAREGAGADSQLVLPHLPALACASLVFIRGAWPDPPSVTRFRVQCPNSLVSPRASMILMGNAGFLARRSEAALMISRVAFVLVGTA